MYVSFAGGVPVIHRHPQNQIVSSNNNVTFECFVVGSDRPFNITWERNKKSYISGKVENTVYRNGTSSSLTIKSVTLRDSGKYRCNVTNGDGNTTVSNEAELISKLFITN